MSGMSAGGVAAMIWVDKFKELYVPAGANYAGVIDSGYKIPYEDLAVGFDQLQL